MLNHPGQVKIMTVTFVPAVDCDNYHILSGLGAWNEPSDMKKCCIHILLSPNLLMNSGWLFTYLSEQMVRVSLASFGPLQAKSFCFEISPSFLLCSWDVWGEVEEDDDQVTQSSGLLLLHILLFLSFREIQECSKCTSEGEPQSGPIMKRKRFFFGLPVSFYQQRYNSVCQKLIWACLT